MHTAVPFSAELTGCRPRCIQDPTVGSRCLSAQQHPSQLPPPVMWDYLATRLPPTVPREARHRPHTELTAAMPNAPGRGACSSRTRLAFDHDEPPGSQARRPCRTAGEPCPTPPPRIKCGGGQRPPVQAHAALLCRAVPRASLLSVSQANFPLAATACAHPTWPGFAWCSRRARRRPATAQDGTPTPSHGLCHEPRLSCRVTRRSCAYLASPALHTTAGVRRAEAVRRGADREAVAFGAAAKRIDHDAAVKALIFVVCSIERTLSWDAGSVGTHAGSVGTQRSQRGEAVQHGSQERGPDH